jgi:hypothetical protein
MVRCVFSLRTLSARARWPESNIVVDSNQGKWHGSMKVLSRDSDNIQGVETLIRVPRIEIM